MKLAQVKVIVLSATTATLLTTAINDWITANGKERTFLGIAYSVTDGLLSALITYTE